MASDDGFVRFFCQHLVALNVACDQPDGTRVRDLYSGFLLEVRGRTFFVTAGHALKPLYDYVLPNRQNVEVTLWDAWHPAASRFPVPINLEDAGHVAIDEHDGLDLGLVELHEVQVRALRANGIRAFDETAWREPPPDLDAFAVVGLPEALFRRPDATSGAPALAVVPAMRGFRKTLAPHGLEKRFPCFYGQVPDATPASVGDVQGKMVGFSGGPILGFRARSDGTAPKYFVVAVQAGWWPKLGVVYGPLTSVVASTLERYLFGV